MTTAPTAPWTTVAVAGHLAAAAAFLWLPWATGEGAFVGRSFTGPELARLARNLDLLLPASAGAAAPALAAAVFLAPVAAVVGALLAGLARWTSRPVAARRIATMMGAVSVVVAVATALLLATGPSAGEALSRWPGPGVVLTAVGGTIAALASRRGGTLGRSDR